MLLYLNLELLTYDIGSKVKEAIYRAVERRFNEEQRRPGEILDGTIETSGSTHQHASPHITDNYSFRSLRIPIVNGALRVSDTVWEPPRGPSRAS